MPASPRSGARPSYPPRANNPERYPPGRPRALRAGAPRTSTLTNDRAEPVPANIGQPGERIVRLPVVAEIHDEWSSLDRRGADEAPVAGIRRVVAVVSQHEIPPGGDDQRTPRVAGRVIMASHAATTEPIVPLPGELRIVDPAPRCPPLHVAAGA